MPDLERLLQEIAAAQDLVELAALERETTRLIDELIARAVEFVVRNRGTLSLTVTLPYGMKFGFELSRDYLMDKAADFVEFRPGYS